VCMLRPCRDATPPVPRPDPDPDPDSDPARGALSSPAPFWLGDAAAWSVASPSPSLPPSTATPQAASGPGRHARRRPVPADPCCLAASPLAINHPVRLRPHHAPRARAARRGTGAAPAIRARVRSVWGARRPPRPSGAAGRHSGGGAGSARRPAAGDARGHGGAGRASHRRRG
jgi:hypothetical protein